MHFTLFQPREKAPEFEYIFIYDDGSARELTPSEREYLSAPFHPFDSGAPYIKSTYEQRTPDKRLRGFMARRQLPKNISVDPAPKDEADLYQRN